MYYNACWNWPYTTQFASPDSIIPDHYNPLDFNRYAYARYNPLKYTDPSGHAVDDGCQSEGCSENGPAALIRLYLTTNIISPVDPWSIEHHLRYDQLSHNIDTYMKNHPDYKSVDDSFTNSELDSFNEIRNDYCMVLLLADQGNNERAVEFYTAALQSSYIANSYWIDDIAGKEMREIVAKLPQHKVDSARARGQTRNLRKTANTLLGELTEASSDLPNYLFKP